MKKAFTLVELLIVIGIIAILSGILMATMSGGSEAARSAQCLTNMRSLANACVAYSSAHDGYYPFAGSLTYSYVDESRGIGAGKAKTVYNERAGWLSWASEGMFPSTSYASGVYPEAYFSGGAVSGEEQKGRDFAITNGALRASLAGNRDILLCPVHKIDMNPSNPFFTYVMNEYFYWNNTDKARSQHLHGRNAKYDALMKHPDRVLLFAEINWKGYAGEVASTEDARACDQVLQYSIGECIGFNHKKGKEKVAHIAFADGHTEQLLLPRHGLNDSDLKNLTTFLCEGKDITLDGDRYVELH